MEGDSENRKDQILERLNKRNKDRQNYLDVKSELRSKETVQNEGVDYFYQTFSQKTIDIEQRLKDVQCGNAQPTDLARNFADITVEIQDLQRYLTASTMFLPDFKIKSCQNILNTLTSASDETRQRLMPKKKFGFSGKKTAAKPKVAPNKDIVDGKLSKVPEKQGSNFTWTIANRTNEHIVLDSAKVNGQDITISNLTHCLVELQGHPGSVQVSRASKCTLLCGPIARSFFAENLEDCTLSIACQQLRLHSSRTIRIYMHVTCRAIIEDCRNIEIGVYNYDYSELEADYLASGLNKAQNNYTDVADFNWLSPDVPSPNWSLLKDYPDPNWNALRRDFIANNHNSGLKQDVKDISII
ncbi:tubulin-specific chaperone C [Drosophila santomea]|uniref:tubulin-specific chaperone C n=1 Tax=Drosophila santomea TaxID=129105 RepID=UPI001953865D|nr:tubulin-specific chaperone C [Drosophila santomea]XP_039482022.1 tubulin-specific chaperone C [Drosophila santomea]XP_039482030.1 tubulin-specific chaperone C [Drosophila santomea]